MFFSFFVLFCGGAILSVCNWLMLNKSTRWGISTYFVRKPDCKKTDECKWKVVEGGNCRSCKKCSDFLFSKRKVDSCGCYKRTEKDHYFSYLCIKVFIFSWALNCRKKDTSKTIYYKVNDFCMTLVFNADIMMFSHIVIIGAKALFVKIYDQAKNEIVWLSSTN